MIGAIILGILAGFIGKALMPGKDPGGFFATILIGLAGALLGYFLFRLIGIGDDDMFDLGGLLGAIIGVMILLFAYRKFVESRTPAVAGTPAGATTPADAATSRPEGRGRRGGRGGGGRGRHRNR